MLPFRKKSYSGFLHSKKNPSSPAGFELENLGSSGEYDKHGATGVDSVTVNDDDLCTERSEVRMTVCGTMSKGREKVKPSADT